MKTLLKLKRKLLSKDMMFVGRQEVSYEIWEKICPICKKEYLSFHIDGRIVYGGEATVFYKDKNIECCGSEECMRKAEKIIEETK